VIDNIHSEHRAIVLEISNIGPMSVKLPVGYGIGMVCFEIASSSVEEGDEHDQYEGQVTVTPPNLRHRIPGFR
jgi:hypothetical protein